MFSRIPLGPLSAIIAVFFFSLNDAAIKFLSGDYALHLIVLFRSLIGLGILLIVIVPFQGGFSVLRTKRLGMHLLRGLCVVAANTTFFLGLAVLPLADAMAIFFVSPLLITAFSALLLGEHVGPRRMAAVSAGLIGVLIMIRPGADEFNVALLFPFAAAFAYAMLHVLTRKIGNTESAATMSVYIQIVFVIVSSIVGLTLGHGAYEGSGPEITDFLLRAWHWPDSGDYWILALLGVASAMGGFFISQAYRISEASMIAPLEYIAMPMGVAFGVVIFGEWPAPTTWIGMVLIIGSGLFVFWREARTEIDTGPDRPRARR
ncbi:Riboflavin transporter [Shimia sp. SK013]|uniref:DMT family transporter n=1 Tax=Shimia sp. SK013 TaxID=1389006 RepID=UPI0006B44809|nr:DMT family transporter [Shimia sp. SK013]KPA23746.1 Riboflavin transporter [Shimia sp. SK013]